MLRPSRPMIRPFISSFGSSTRRVVVSLGVLGREPLHRDREDVAGAALGLALGLRLDLLQPHPGLVAGLLLDLGEQQLLGLRGAQPRDPLQLAPLDPLGLLQLLGLLGRGCARGPRAPACAARGRRAGRSSDSVSRRARSSIRAISSRRAAELVASPAPLELARAAPARRLRRLARLARAATVARARVSPSLPLPGPAVGRLRSPATAQPSGPPRPAAPETLLTAEAVVARAARARGRRTSLPLSRARGSGRAMVECQSLIFSWSSACLQAANGRYHDRRPWIADLASSRAPAQAARRRSSQRGSAS